MELEDRTAADKQEQKPLVLTEKPQDPTGYVKYTFIPKIKETADGKPIYGKMKDLNTGEYLKPNDTVEGETEKNALSYWLLSDSGKKTTGKKPKPIYVTTKEIREYTVNGKKVFPKLKIENPYDDNHTNYKWEKIGKVSGVVSGDDLFGEPKGKKPKDIKPTKGGDSIQTSVFAPSDSVYSINGETPTHDSKGYKLGKNDYDFDYYVTFKIEDSSTNKTSWELSEDLLGMTIKNGEFVKQTPGEGVNSVTVYMSKKITQGNNKPKFSDKVPDITIKNPKDYKAWYWTRSSVLLNGNLSNSIIVKLNDSEEKLGVWDEPKRIYPKIYTLKLLKNGTDITNVDLEKTPLPDETSKVDFKKTEHVQDDEIYGKTYAIFNGSNLKEAGVTVSNPQGTDDYSADWYDKKENNSYTVKKPSEETINENRTFTAYAFKNIVGNEEDFTVGTPANATEKAEYTSEVVVTPNKPNSTITAPTVNGLTVNSEGKVTGTPEITDWRDDAEEERDVTIEVTVTNPADKAPVKKNVVVKVLRSSKKGLPEVQPALPEFNGGVNGEVPDSVELPKVQLIITKWIDEQGNELKPADAKAPAVLGEANEAFEHGGIEGYVFVRTDVNEEGDVVTHVFRKVTPTKPEGNGEQQGGDNTPQPTPEVPTDNTERKPETEKPTVPDTKQDEQPTQTVDAQVAPSQNQAVLPNTGTKADRATGALGALSLLGAFGLLFAKKKKDDEEETRNN